MSQLKFAVIAIAVTIGAWLLQAARPAPNHVVPYFANVGGVPVWQHAGSDEVMRLPDFAFTTFGHKAVTRKELANRIVIVDFALAGCTDICPPKQKALHRVMTKVQDDGDTLVVSFLLNRNMLSDRDFSNYAKEARIPSSDWLLAQAPAPEIDRFCRSIPVFGPLCGKDGKTNVDSHSDNVLLVDRAGYFRGVYHAASPIEVQHLIEDITKLRQEV